VARKGGRWTPEELAALTARPIVKTAPLHRTQQARRKAITRPASEFEECLTFVAWSKLVLFAEAPLWDRLAHVPNEREKGTQRAKLAAIGVKSGYPDYVIDAPFGGWHGLRIEAKREKGGKIDTDQIEYRDRLIRWNYYAAICEGHREMVDAVRTYMRESGATAAGVFIDNTRFVA
jgi:hypothetical protein